MSQPANRTIQLPKQVERITWGHRERNTTYREPSGFSAGLEGVGRASIYERNGKWEFEWKGVNVFLNSHETFDEAVIFGFHHILGELDGQQREADKFRQIRQLIIDPGATA